MLAERTSHILLSQCRSYTSAHGLRAVRILPNAGLETFRRDAFEPAIPTLFPRGSFSGLPAIRKWFTPSATSAGQAVLNRSYLARFGSVHVPLEITNNDDFTRIEQSLSFFLECVQASSSTYQVRPSRYFSAYVPGARAIRRTTESNDFFSAAPITPPLARIYLAQAPIADLPQALRDDLPTPELVLKAGKGDVYDSSIWLGQAPTYTPLHRDPNPNLFVQLAGKKRVRLLRPDVGRAVFATVQEKIGGDASATMRGEEMMQGIEKRTLEEEIWGKKTEWGARTWEAELDSGDGLFIPKAWWHSIKGTGEGMTGSVSVPSSVDDLAYF